MERVVERLDQLRPNRLAQTPLSEDRLREFYDAVTETVGTAHQLRGFLGVSEEQAVGSVSQAAHEDMLLGRVLSGIGRGVSDGLCKGSCG